MPSLDPVPSSLGVPAPTIGPWFANASSLALKKPNGDDLGISLQMPANSQWLPPAGGTLSVFLGATPPPWPIAALRKASGDSPFAAGSLVFLFRLLPEVEQRLHDLLRYIPLATANKVTDPTTVTPATAPTRARVRDFVVEIAAVANETASATLTRLKGLLDPQPPGIVSSDEEIAEYFGLKLENNTLSNGKTPMCDLKRPGVFTILTSTSQDVLLKFTSQTNVIFHAFDAGGRALDAGAVACWWTFVTKVFDNLWAKDVDKNVASVSNEDQLTLQLTNAHEGPAAGKIFDTRLKLTNTSGTGQLRARSSSASGAIALSFTAAPTDKDDDDTAPVPRMALLPTGKYDKTLSLWPDGALHDSLKRDHVRVALVDIESHLVGVKRDRTSDSTPAERRAKFQGITSARTNVAQLAPAVSTEPWGLLTAIDESATALLGVFDTSGTRYLVAGAAERDFGPLDAPILPAGSPLEELPEYTGATTDAKELLQLGRKVGIVRAVVGAGSQSGDTVTKQQVLIELALGTALAGAWARVWPHGLNFATGIHTRLDGGSAFVRGDGTLSVLVPLPDGDATPPALMAVDLLLAAGSWSHFYPDLRFERPLVVAGAAIPLSSATNVLLCESGTVTAASLIAGTIPPGTRLLDYAPVGSPVTLIDRTSSGTGDYDVDTLIRKLATGDFLALTQPAFRREPAGDDAAVFASTGATVHHRARAGWTNLHEAGAPLPTLERLDTAASRIAASDARAAVGAGPLFGRSHEFLPHAEGHPGAPATTETHATGVALSGPPATAVAELTRDRVMSNSDKLVETAYEPLPDVTGGTSNLWAATLRTVAAGVEMEPGVADGLILLSSLFPFGPLVEKAQGVFDWLKDRNIPTSNLPSPVDSWAQQLNTFITNVTTQAQDIEPHAVSIARALDRRTIAGAYGAKEMMIALLAAIDRAEDFLYLETPAIDDLKTSEIDANASVVETFGLIEKLGERMGKRPGLRVLLCLPVKHFAEVPAMSRMRDQVVAAGLKALRTAAGADAAARVVAFSPSAGPGRSLRLASTTAIVDDAFVVTGTTHLWRRGLTFDSSLAVSVFDENVSQGRPTALRTFRQSLIANRLGLDAEAVPEDAGELIEAARLLVDRGHSARLATDAINPPTPALTADDVKALNPDGSRNPTFDAVNWIVTLTAFADADDAPNP